MDEIERIYQKLSHLKKCVDFLSSKARVSREELEEDYELRSAIERNFQIAIESALDVGEIIISFKGFEKPEDYRSVILILGKNGVLPNDFAKEFSFSAGFRNILVHMYEDVDIDMLHDFLKNKLGDFDEFARYIIEYVEKEMK
jgi:uncharacterized protein YutE (UPF0331/DUF86 family)